MRAAPLILSVGLAFTGSAHAWEWNSLTGGMTVQQVTAALARRGESMRLLPQASTGSQQNYILDRSTSAGTAYLNFCRGVLTGYTSNIDAIGLLI